MKMMNEMKIGKKVMAVIVAALVLAGGAFTAVLWSAETDNAEAKAVKAGMEQIAGEKTVKEAEKAEAKKGEKKEEGSDAGEKAESVAEKGGSNKTSRSGVSASDSASVSGNSNHSAGSNSASKPSGNSGTGTSTASTHTHSWTAVYKTVSVPVQESYRVHVCSACGSEDISDSHRKAHLLAGEPGGYHSTTKYRTVYVEEQQLSHYQCSCGATK